MAPSYDLTGVKSPDGYRGLAERVVTGQLLAGETSLDAFLHACRQLSVLDQLEIELLHVAEVEEVTLPFDEPSVIQPEPASPMP
jgi:hypothetical protein